MNKKLLRFTASLCGPCKSLAKTLETMSIDIPIEVVDIDENSDVAIKYGIRGVPTLVMLEDNCEVGRLVGAKSATELQTWIKSV